MKENIFSDKRNIAIIVLIVLILIVGYFIFIKDSSSNKGDNDYQNNNNTIVINSLTLNANNLELSIGKNYQLTVKIDPINANEKTIIWKSSNTNVVVVDNNGKVTAKAEGTATITATNEKSKTTDTCKIVVLPNNIEIDKIILPTNNLTLSVGDKYQVTAVVSPNNASNKTLSYVTTSSQIATVSTAGEITAVGVGSANILVIASNNTMATLTLNVIAKVSGVSPICPSSLYYLNSSKTSCIQYLYYSSCPSGYTFDNSTQKCRTTKSADCAYPATILSNGDCSLTQTSAPLCTTGTYDANTRKCISSVAPSCTTGVFSPVDNLCMNGTSSCTTGAYYYSGTRKCYYDQTATCPQGYTMQNGVCKNIYNQTATAVCPTSMFFKYELVNNNICRLTMNPECTSGTLDYSNGICETGGYTSIKCSSGTYNSTTKTCNASYSFKCATGYTPNIVSGICQKTNITDACPSDYSYDTSLGKCVKKTNPTCSSTSHSINSSGYCTGTNAVTPTCPNGYTYSNGTCLNN